MNIPPRSLTLVTVSSRSFLPGTRVMLDSFLANNRWFSGAIRVIETELDQSERAGLAEDFPGLACGAPPDPLWQALARLADARPSLAGRIARFYSLAAFWHEGEGDILFCDSDLVFTRDVAEIFEPEAPLVAAPDRAMLAGHRRDPRTLEELPASAALDSHRSFNAGLMLIREDARGEVQRDAILAALTPEWWENIRSDHTDQAVLYHLFGDRVALLDQRFNRLVGHMGQLRGVADLPLDQALALHFNGPAKPWKLEQHRAAAQGDGAWIKALEIWLAAHRRYLARRHLACIASR